MCLYLSPDYIFIFVFAVNLMLMSVYSFVTQACFGITVPSPDIIDQA